MSYIFLDFSMAMKLYSCFRPNYFKLTVPYCRFDSTAYSWKIEKVAGNFLWIFWVSLWYELQALIIKVPANLLPVFIIFATPLSSERNVINTMAPLIVKGTRRWKCSKKDASVTQSLPLLEIYLQFVSLAAYRPCTWELPPLGLSASLFAHCSFCKLVCQC